MSTLYLIRHAQASFGAEDYDVLSPLGRQQAGQLGDYFAARDIELDAVFTGPRKRQLDTATLMCEAAARAGAELPEPIEIAELDEYPAFDLFRLWLPKLIGELPELAGEPSRRTMQRAVELVSQKWARGELDTGDLETFASFVSRVDAGISAIMKRVGRKKSAAVVTSGGPVSATMRRTLGLDDDTMLKVIWVIANSSISEFRYRSDDLSLISFNALPHISKPGLVTYR